MTLDRVSLKQATINNILQISLNGIGTASFDPREAVAEFLKRKNRRNSQPDTERFKVGIPLDVCKCTVMEHWNSNVMIPY